MILRFSILCLISITLSTFQGDCAKIIVLLPSHVQSHLIIHMSVVRTLAEHGHNLTVVTNVPLNDPSPKYHHIKLADHELKYNATAFVRTNGTLAKMKMAIEGMKLFLDATSESMKSEKFQKIFREETFDLVILGYFFNEFQLGVAQHFKCPVIVIWMVQHLGIVNELVGNPSEVSIVQSPFLGANRRMNFWERFKNYLANLLESTVHPVLSHMQKLYYDDLFPAEKGYPSFDEARKNVSLILCNHHFSDGPVRANVPAIVEIGGIQIKPKPDPLPQDIKEFLEKSKKDGAIFFSLGSNVHSTDLRPETVALIYKVLSGLKQNVLWKWEDEANTPGKSPNILFKKWLPQDDILAHPNIHLFITHGGKGSVVESEYHGVPMVGLPVFGDQPMNVESFVAAGFGVGLNYQALTEEDLKTAINEVLTNSTYKDNVKRYSTLYRDRPMTARETATYWIEYVIRHHGAPHLQSQAVHLNKFQYLSLDVLAFLIAVVYLSFKFTTCSFKFIWRKCRGTKTLDNKKSNKKPKKE